MVHHKVPFHAVLGAGILCALACAKQVPSDTRASRVQETSGAITETETLRATVQNVDSERRLVTLRDEGGTSFVVAIGDSVDIARIKPNDALRLAYQTSIAFALADKERAELAPGPAVEQRAERIPDGVQFARKVSATVEIVSVTKDGSHATFRVPDGALRTVYVDDKPSQTKIANMRPGDAVAVTYTEKLALALDPAFDD
jgi:hypothetical protein